MELAGFEKFTSQYTHRLIVGLGGMWRTGKTHFALTAPGPIVYFSTDRGLEGTGEKFAAAGKEILWNRYNIPLEIRHITELLSMKKQDKDVAMPLHYNWAEACEIWAQYSADWERALKSDARTIVHDTFTEAIELIRVARFGQLTQVERFNYYPVYTEVRQLMKMAQDYNKNVIFIFRMREKYEHGEATGQMAPDAIPRMEHLVQVMIETGREIRDDGGMGKFYIDIKDCGQNSALAGVRLWQPACDFTTLGMMAFPGTRPDQWK